MRALFRPLAFMPIGCLLLTACGGSSEAPPPAPATPAGWWSGTTGGGQTARALVLSSGAYYLYYTASASDGTPAGLVYGQGSVSSSQFTDAQARHYRLSGNSTVIAGLTATFTPQTRFDGSVSDGVGSFTWTATWDSANAGTPSTAAVTGTYTGVWAAQPVALPAVFTVASNGQFVGLTGTCAFSGRLSPRSDVNAYDLAIGFSGFPCTSPNQDFIGVAYYDATQRTLIGVSANTAQDSAALLVASRP